MLASEEYIKKVVLLSDFGIGKEFKVGSHVIRGYADLGYEEFIVSGSQKITSLYTGTSSPLPEEHRHFFIEVPSIDALINLLSRQGFDIGTVSFEAQRAWRIEARHFETQKSIVCEHREFPCALAGVLIEVLKNHANDSGDTR